MDESKLRIEGAIEYGHDIIEGLVELAGVLDKKEAATVTKVISVIETMMEMDFGVQEDRKLDS